MLNRFDDYPIHQTPEPIAHPASSDLNVYDRTWFNGFAIDATAYFGIGMAIYPHREVMDCAFSTVTAGGRQHAFIASRRAPLERTETSVGPMQIEVLEPMRRMRVVLDENETGLACDLTFTARTGPIEEARQTLWRGTRRVMDSTRFDQFGRWTGTVTTPDGSFEVDEHAWRGTKDRSWGIRTVGERVPGAPGPLPQVFFLWAPLHWDDHVTHAIFFDDADGAPLVREGWEAPLFRAEAEVPDAPLGLEKRMATARHRVVYVPSTRLASQATIDLVPQHGEVRTITLEPVLRFHMKGLGYLHPTWGHGVWKGELAVHGESYDLDALDLLDPANIHVQQVVRARDDTGREGIGVLEQLVIGPYAPAGFSGLFDGAGA